MITSPNQFDSTFKLDTPRQYLEQFFSNKQCLVVTDQNLNQGYSVDLLVSHASQITNLDQIIIDVSHNPCPIKDLRRRLDELIMAGNRIVPTVVLINDYEFYYKPQEHYAFFPVFSWMFSLKKAYWWYVDDKTFDVPSNKTQAVCSLNRNPAWHRVVLFNQLAARPWFNNIAYTFGNFSPDVPYNRSHRSGLTEDDKQQFENNQHLLPRWVVKEDQTVSPDVYGIEHPVHESCAFNLITETNVSNQYFHSEKLCKPFMAYQIPIMLGAKNISKFCQDVGLDMFEDIVPWQQWDNSDSARTRIARIVNFIDDLMQQDAVEIYHQNIQRVIRNKKYFHSQDFRNQLLVQMPKSCTSQDIDEFF